MEGENLSKRTSEGNMAKDSLNTVAIKIPMALCAFISVVFLTALLGVEGNGVYNFILANLILATNVLGFNFRYSYTYFVASKRIALDQLGGIGILVTLAIVILFSVFVFCIQFAPVEIRNVFFPENYYVGYVIAFYIVYLLSAIAKLQILGILAGKLNFRSINTYEFVIQIVRVLALGILFFVRGNGNYEGDYREVYILLASLAVFEFAYIVSIYVREVGTVPSFKKVEKSIVNGLVTYSFEGYFVSIATFLNKRVDVWFVEFYYGFRALGLYGLATQITNFLLEFMLPLNFVLLPYLTKYEELKGQKMFFQLFRISVFVLLFMIAAVWIFAPVFIPLFFGENFVSSIDAIRILSISVCFYLMRNFLFTFNKAYDRQKFSLRAAWLGVCVTIVLDFVLIPKYGIIGAASAAVLANGFTFCYVLFTLIPILRIPIRGLFLMKKEDYMFVKSLFETMWRKNY